MRRWPINNKSRPKETENQRLATNDAPHLSHQESQRPGHHVKQQQITATKAKNLPDSHRPRPDPEGEHAAESRKVKGER